jgi:hypothetical protein
MLGERLEGDVNKSSYSIDDNMPERPVGRHRSVKTTEGSQEGKTIDTTPVIKVYLQEFLDSSEKYSINNLPPELQQIANKQTKAKSRGISSFTENERNQFIILDYLKAHSNLTEEQYQEGLKSIEDPRLNRRRVWPEVE